MNYEENYKNALKRASKLRVQNPFDTVSQMMEHIFPELAESEDERIKNDIRGLIEFALEDGSAIAPGRNTTKEEALAWLENQGKKENEDEIIPDKNEVRDIEQNLAGNDEKIRKAIICGMYALKEQHRRYFASIPVDDVIAWLEKQRTSYTTKDIVESYIKGLNDAKNEIEKQYEADYQIRKDIATFIFNYKGDIKDRAKWMNYLGVKAYFFEREDERPQGKSALDAIKEENVDNANKNISKFKAEDWYVSKVDGKIHNVHLDKVKPKFSEGDWIVQGCNILQIKCVGDEYYCFETVGGYVDDMLISEIDSLYHLWTIQDAKDGDILAFDDNTIVIFKDLYNNTSFHTYCYFEGGVFDISRYNTSYRWGAIGFHPATKKQCNILFSKMKKAGYEWDAKNKELKG